MDTIPSHDNLPKPKASPRAPPAGPTRPTKETHTRVVVRPSPAAVAVLGAGIGIAIGMIVLLALSPSTSSLVPMDASIPYPPPDPSFANLGPAAVSRTISPAEATANALAAEQNAIWRVGINLLGVEATARAKAEATYAPAPTSTPLAMSCLSPVPGLPCQWPTMTPLPTLVPTPYPVCGSPVPSAICTWPVPTAVPAQAPMASPRPTQ